MLVCHIKSFQQTAYVTLSVIALLSFATTAIANTTAIERGRYLSAAGGCLSCHTDREDDGPAYAGGHQLKTPYGTFVVPNITPDLKTGIGGWSDKEFVAAIRQGISPDGDYYYPAFPYPAYAGMTEQDVLDIKAYLDSLAPIAQDNKPHELNWYVPGRWSMGIWQALFAPWEYSPLAAESSAELKRGAYLVRHLGHCGECHTRRDLFGALENAFELAGSPEQGDIPGAPDITPNPNSGIGNWSAVELEFFLEMGMLPDGDFTGGNMVHVIDDNTALLTAEDRRAIVKYLQQLSPAP